MPTRNYRFEPGARIFFGALIALFWSFCAWGLADADVRNDLGSLLCVFFLFALPLPLVDCLLWRLRLDEHGVTQTVYGWGVTWPWEDFDYGAIEMEGDRCFVRTDWPWWRIGRKLHLSLDLEEREEVLAVIGRYCQQSSLLESSVERLHPRPIPRHTGHVAAKILRGTLAMSLVIVIQLAIVTVVICAWILFEVVVDFEFFRLLDEQDAKLVIVFVWAIVCYLSTDAILSLLERVGLHRREELFRIRTVKNLDER
jgi:hypothetical protein